MAISKKKRINVVSQFWPPNFVGGGEISTYIICKELAKRGYEITVLTPNVPNTSNEEFIFLELRNPPIFLEPLEKIYFKKISSEDKLQNGVYWASDFYGAAFLSDKKVKKIVTVRDYWPICSCGDAISIDSEICYERDLKSVLNCNKIRSTPFFLKIARIIKYLHNYSFRKHILYKFDHVVFISNFVRDKILFEIPLKNYSVIYNPISQSFVQTPMTTNKIHNNVLFVGAVIGHKGPQVLISAMKKILDKKPKINLTIVGRIYDDSKIIAKKLKVSNNIKFINQVPNDKLVEFYDLSDIIVNSSLWLEPFGRTIIEGMARGCIPIAPYDTGSAEVIKDSGTGYLFKKGDDSDLAEIIIRIYSDQENIIKFRMKARGYAIKNFSPQRITVQYEEIFKKYL